MSTQNDSSSLLHHLHQQQTLVIDPKRRNGVILVKPYHAEFAGPGAFIGGNLDKEVLECHPVGNIAWAYSQPPDELIRALLIRRQWVLLLKQIVNNPHPTERAQLILNQMKRWFDSATVSTLTIEVFADLVGVLPQTIIAARQDLSLIF